MLARATSNRRSRTASLRSQLKWWLSPFRLRVWTRVKVTAGKSSHPQNCRRRRDQAGQNPLAGFLQLEKQINSRRCVDPDDVGLLHLAGPAFSPLLPLGRRGLTPFIKILDEAAGNQFTYEFRLHETLRRQTLG